MNPEPYFDVPSASICFVVDIAGRPVACHVTEGWMYDQFGPLRLRWGLLDAYRRNARSIDAAAAKCWRESGGDEPVWLVRGGSDEAKRSPLGSGHRSRAEVVSTSGSLPSLPQKGEAA
jgi:hypothetical protein